MLQGRVAHGPVGLHLDGDDLQHDLVLALPVPVEIPLGIARVGRDLGHGRGHEALGREKPFGGFEQLALRLKRFFLLFPGHVVPFIGQWSQNDQKSFCDHIFSQRPECQANPRKFRNPCRDTPHALFLTASEAPTSLPPTSDTFGCKRESRANRERTRRREFQQGHPPRCPLGAILGRTRTVKRVGRPVRRPTTVCAVRNGGFAGRAPDPRPFHPFPPPNLEVSCSKPRMFAD
ncbi:hypothetical protein DSECCO2_654410 [anaerobic digester metagenome]